MMRCMTQKKNDTQDMIGVPKGGKIVSCCKQIFTIKYKADGVVKGYKSSLVAKEFTLTYSIDYQETFIPVEKNKHYSYSIVFSC